MTNKHQYRKNVGIVVFNQDKKILLCERADTERGQWQFPQGGIDAGETVLEAAVRELFEETGIKSVQLVKVLEKPIKYDFPKDIYDRFTKNNPKNIYIGQEQEWVLYHFFGDDSEIDLETDKHVEFVQYQWTNKEFAIENIIHWKKDLYRKVLKTFQKYIDEF